MKNDIDTNGEVTIFTDGSSRGNPGSGGWGTVVIAVESGDGAKAIELGGREAMTTNNRMELMAAIQGLSFSSVSRLAKDVSITVFTDSSYLINGITKWIHGWKRNDWKTKTKEDVLNKDLWMSLADAVANHDVKWKYVGGHVGIVGNERCDVIATGFADGEDVVLYDGPFSGYKFKNILNVSHDLDKVAVKRSSSSHSKAKAYSYVSAVNGKIEVHGTWAECEKRVKGTRGARYKKALSPGNEIEIKNEFGGK